MIFIKQLCRIGLLLLIASLLVPSIGNAEDTELDTQAKYEALKAKGIFTGMADGTAGLDQSMNRAQFARVTALILGLEGSQQSVISSFKDVSPTHWAIEEIQAVKEAAIMIGNGDGTFNPNGNISVQELAVVTARILSIEPVEGAVIKGAANWAAGYIHSLLDYGIDFPTNYTAPASREQLVQISYFMDEKVTIEKDERVSIKNAKQIGAKKILVELTKSVEGTDAYFNTTSSEQFTTEWDSDYKTATIQFNKNLEDGNITVHLLGINPEDVFKSSSTVTTTKETIVKLEFTSASGEVGIAKAIAIPFKVFNQFGEEMTNYKDDLTLVPSGISSATIDASTQAVIADTSTKKKGEIISLTIFTKNNIFVSRSFQIGDEVVATKVQLHRLYDASGQAVSQAVWGDVYYVSFDLFDRNGNALLPQMTDTSSLTLTGSFNVSLGSAMPAANGERGAFKVPVFGVGPEITSPTMFVVSAFITTPNSTSTSQQTFTMVPKPKSEGEPESEVYIPPVIFTPTVSTPNATLFEGYVTITVEDSDATIYYTTDGSQPTRGSTLYSSPFVITTSTTVKVIAVKSGWNNSAVATFTFTIPLELPETILPTSITTSGEYFEGSLAATGGTGTITYEITNGSLPYGLSMNMDTGEIYGIPLYDGVFDFTVTATDSANNEVSQAYTMTITNTLSPEAALDLINEAIASGTWTGVGLDVFETAGIVRLTEEYLTGIQYTLEEDYLANGQTTKTLEDIQKIVDEVIHINLINNYFAYGYGIPPTAQFYEYAGITGVTEDNVVSINDILQPYYGALNPFHFYATKEQIQEVIDIYLES